MSRPSPSARAHRCSACCWRPRQRVRFDIALAAMLGLLACDDPDAQPVSLALDASVIDGAVGGPVLRDSDAGEVVHEGESAAKTADAAASDDSGGLAVYVPPSVAFPTDPPAQPFLLSQLGLYLDAKAHTLAPDLIAYEPSYVLWSDGAQKTRHLRLPAGARIDNRDPDHFQFPVGSVLFKEFALADKKLETRVIARTGSGPRDYFFGAFVWRDDESDAVLSWDGQSNVRGSEHDVPSVKQCGTCHNGEPGRVLGVSAVQTPQLALPLELPSAEPYRVPGSEREANALGYLHANCGHCHNPSGSARPDTDLMLRLSVTEHTVASTAIYRSNVDVKLQSFQGTALTLRVVPGDRAQSGLYFRMSQRGPRTQMPPIASEAVDEHGLTTVGAFIDGLAQVSGADTLPH